MNFKDQIERDISQVFHNTAEFGEMREVVYLNIHYDVSVIMEYNVQQDRKKTVKDHTDNFFTVNARAYIPFTQLGRIPRKNKKIEIDGERYKIIKSGNEDGEIVLNLEQVDE